MKVRFCILTAAFIAVIGFGVAFAQADTWDMAGDLHASALGTTPTNSNGDWTYGSSPTVGGAFAVSPVLTDSSAWWPAGTVLGWAKSGDNYPFWLLPGIWSVMSDTSALGAVPTTTGQMVVHPGVGDTECAVVRWTAPATGLYSVAASWESINGMVDYAYNAGVDVHLLKNGVSIYDGVTSYYNSTGPATMGSTMLSLTMGDILDFVTCPLGIASTKQGDLTYAADMTIVGATITAVPEPGTIALFGSAMFGLLVYAWRRR